MDSKMCVGGEGTARHTQAVPVELSQVGNRAESGQGQKMKEIKWCKSRKAAMCVQSAEKNNKHSKTKRHQGFHIFHKPASWECTGKNEGMQGTRMKYTMK